MTKLKTASILALAFLSATIPAKGNPVSDSTPPSLFSFLKGDTSFSEALEASHHATPDMISFYEQMKKEPVWFPQGRLNAWGKVALEVLKNADQDGLNPQDYEDALRITDRPEKWVDAEILLTKRFLEFIEHLRVGRIDPMKISPDIKFHNAKIKPVDLLVEALHDQVNGATKLRFMASPLPQYTELKQLLKDYRKQAAEIKDWPKLVSQKPLKKGDSDPEVQSLRRILILHGDLEETDQDSEKFDAALESALRQFQKRYSLDPDGTVGPRTRSALNYHIEDMIQKIIVNMERLRWLPQELGDKHIIVNIAGYVLQGYEKSDLTLSIPVIVGRPDRHTPLFYTKLKDIVLNPWWGVPYRIYVEDKLPQIIRDPGYLHRAKFTVFDQTGKVIDPNQVDWRNRGKQYYLRQSPGAHNALGQIKFNIENPYTIYLHGTPEGKLFAKKARAYSSGCIRLKYPLKLAAWILNHESQWSVQNIEAAILTGTTQTIKPDEYIPVYFIYQTIWIKNSKKGRRIVFSDDPYYMDTKMIKILKLQKLCSSFS